MLEHGIEKSTDFLWNIQLKYIYRERASATALVNRARQDELDKKRRLDKRGSAVSSRYVIQAKKEQSASAQVADAAQDEQARQADKERLALDALSEDFYPVHVKMRMIEAEQVYGYEFLSNSARLVISPLTERCFQSLFLALHYKYGGAPIGPAGTGKTESIKEMAKNMARHCYVFNCQVQIDYTSMSKFFKGLAANGTWVCFDEFNRLEIQVLAIISQLIIALSSAKEREATTICIEDKVLPFNPYCGLFITMNPFNFGRTPLPDNLKALFRQVTMVVPDTLFIAEILLYSVGFANARNLAIKITRTFTMIQQQLRGEEHYDFGLRTVKQVLIHAGELKLRCIKVKTKANIEADAAAGALQDYLGGLTRLTTAPKSRKPAQPARKEASDKAARTTLLQNLRETSGPKGDSNPPATAAPRHSIEMPGGQPTRPRRQTAVRAGGGNLKSGLASSAYSNVGTVKDGSFTDTYVPKPIEEGGAEGSARLPSDVRNDTILEEPTLLTESSSTNSVSDADEEESEEEVSSTEERMRRLVRTEERKKQVTQSSLDLEEEVREDDSQADTSSKHSDESACQALGLDRDYIVRELGCTARKVMLNEELLDQFIVLKAIMDKNLPKLLFKDMQIL